MTLSIVLASAWLTAVLFFQTGSVPIWVPLAIILIIVLIFWWGLTRGNIPEEGETGGEHGEGHDDTEHAAAGHEGTLEVDESDIVMVEADENADQQPSLESEVDQAADAEMEELPEADDLTRIEGIGPKIAGILAAVGITTYATLAGTGTAKLEEIVRVDAGIKVADPTSWPQQAALAANGDWDGLQAFQKSLIAGRHRE